MLLDDVDVDDFVDDDDDDDDDDDNEDDGSPSSENLDQYSLVIFLN